MAQGVAYLTHSDCARHDLGPWHSEFPKRLAAIDQALREAAWFDCLLAVVTPAATQEQILQARVDTLRDAVPGSGVNRLDPDAGLNPFSREAALRAAGAAERAVDGVTPWRRTRGVRA
jgi:acetoin utilization deacetylase AcuC-like enzyme